MQIHREVPAPVQEQVEQHGSLQFWGNVVTTCQITAVQILDDMVAVNFQSDEQDSIPVPVLTWYFWARASVLVQAEQAMSEGAHQRDLSATVQIAQDLAKQMTWLETAERLDGAEQNALRQLHGDITMALKARPFHRAISDQSYGGLIVEPNRIQLVPAG